MRKSLSILAVLLAGFSILYGCGKSSSSSTSASSVNLSLKVNP